MRRYRIVATLIAVAAAAVAAAAPGTGARAAPPDAEVSAADPSAPASRVPHDVEVVSINQYGQMADALRAKAEQVALAIGAPSQPGRGFTIGLHAVRRGDAVVQQATGGLGLWQFPLSVTALPIDAAGRVMSLRVSSLLARGQVVMSQTSADLRGAQPGDVIDLVAADGGLRSFVIGAVAPDAEVGGTELVMSFDQADQVGATIVTRVLIFGVIDHARLDAALAAQGLVDGVGVRISKSWNPPNPDGLLGLGTTKKLLGEFSYRVDSSDSMTMDAGWVDANIVRVNYQYIGVRASCHRLIAGDLQAALRDVYEAGLSSTIDLANTNTFGGCWNPRYARASASIGSLSRHAWGMALDANTTSNAQGSTPRMDCRVVRIFRKHNFAWGGNFLIPDGMHFEWVGEPRHTWPYPSKYCPNLAGGMIESWWRVTPTQEATMFAFDEGAPVVEPQDPGPRDR